MELLIFAICLAASTIGGLCGIGGGVIIKPSLELMGVMSVSAVSFLSGLSVMSMSAISVFRQRKTRRVELRIGSLLAVGVTTLIAMQTFLNIAVVTGLLPTTGISLPFFSYGGTALSMQLAEMGIVLSVSRQMKPTKAG